MTDSRAMAVRPARRPPTPPRRRAGRSRRALRIAPRGALALALTSLVGLAAFGWPLLASGGLGAGHDADAPLLFVVLVPLVIAVVLAELSAGVVDAKAIAVLGVLAAVGAGLRAVSPGVAGIEPVFFLLICAGRVFGPGFGFATGSVVVATSAFLTGGIGPWLPFQMLGYAWAGLGAGLLPPTRRRAGEVGLLAGYGVVAAFGYGVLLDMWMWPFTAQLAPPISFVPGGSLAVNLERFGAFYTATSLGWDAARAGCTVVLLAVAGPAVLATLRRAARRAAFGAAVGFDPGRAGPVVAGTDSGSDPGRDAGPDPAGDTAAGSTGPAAGRPATGACGGAAGTPTMR